MSCTEKVEPWTSAVSHKKRAAAVTGGNGKAKKVAAIPAQEATLEGLPSEVLARIVLTLCHNPHLNAGVGGHVDQNLYLSNVYPLFLASPRVYRLSKQAPKCAEVIKRRS